MASVSFLSTAKFTELLSQADPHKLFNIKILSSTKLALGTDPLRPSVIIDLAKEVVTAFDSSKSKNLTPPEIVRPIQSSPIVVVTRKSGDYQLKFKGQTNRCRSLKELLAEGLRAIELHRPGTLEQLSSIGHAKRIVSRNPNMLFRQEHLVEKYSAKLMDGWWYGTNNSAQETKSWLKKGCTLASLRWGAEFDVVL